MAAASAQQFDGFAMNTFFGEQVLTDFVEGIKLKSCLGCTAAVNSVDSFAKTEWFTDTLLSIASKVCTTFHIATPTTICPQIVHQYGSVLLDVVFNEIITRDRICNESMGVCTHPTIEQIDVRDVVNEILATKPDYLKDDDYLNNLYEQIKQEGGIDSREIITAVHVSDLHMDMLYKEGTLASCDGYLCCREEVGYPTSPDQTAAGQWGSYHNCDMPQKSIQNMLDFVASEINPDMIFWTGDNNAHNVWENTAEEVTEYMNVISGMVSDTFKDTDTVILPV